MPISSIMVIKRCIRYSVYQALSTLHLGGAVAQRPEGSKCQVVTHMSGMKKTPAHRSYRERGTKALLLSLKLNLILFS